MVYAASRPGTYRNPTRCSSCRADWSDGRLTEDCIECSEHEHQQQVQIQREVYADIDACREVEREYRSLIDAPVFYLWTDREPF